MTEAAVGWGIVGPGEIAAVFATSLRACGAGELVRVHGRSAERSASFTSLHGGACASSLEQLVEDPQVQAIYVATPHVHHAKAVRVALEAGKAVLCEKPMSVSPNTTRDLHELAARRRTPLVEAWMYRCHPQIARVLRLVGSEAIGAPIRLRSRFCFAAEADPGSRLFDPGLGGGAILDVGGYPISLALALGAGELHPKILRTSGTLTTTGVDASAEIELQFRSGLHASLACSIETERDRMAVIECEHATIAIEDPFVPGGDRHGLEARLRIESRIAEKPELEIVASAHDCFALEAIEMARMIRTGAHQPSEPMVGPAESAAIAELCSAWRQRIGALSVRDEL